MTQAATVYPLTFEPALKDYIWGGRHLETVLGRALPPGVQIAESWEVAAHPDGQSVVAAGAYAGQTLAQVHAQLGLDLIGTRSAWAQARGKFPLLIKLLDANQPLSVQVHPPDDYALAHAGNELGKTEMWVILHAEPDAAVILGLRAGTTADDVRQAIAAGDLERHLYRLPVRAGDFVDVPAGSLHAILGGILIAEIQQNSNTTYRVYDWNRVDKSGRPRALHVERALDVINFAQVQPALPQPTLLSAADGVRRERLVQNRYFTVERWTLAAGAQVNGTCDGSTFEIWGTLDGTARLWAHAASATAAPATAAVTLPAIRFALLPAALGRYTLAADGATTLLRTFVAA